MSRITSYRLVLPEQWVGVPVGSGTRARVHLLVEAHLTEVPKELPPDQVGPLKRQLEERMVRDILRAEEYGGLDCYFPVQPVHGFHLGTSFVVSQISPPGGGDDPDQLVGGVLAELVAGGASTVSIDDTLWVRAESVIAPDPEKAPDVDVPTRRVTYTAALPDDPRRWMLVAFSCVGDGTPDGELTLLTVELFDAIMSTWRWTRADERAEVG